MATGLLLVNLGTPDEPTAPAVRRYLRQFLSDPRVLDMNAVGRWLLLELIILPRRPKQSAHAYGKIWDAQRGSPLLYHSRDLAAAVAERLGAAWKVELAMRYGNPSIAAGLAALRAADVDRVVVLPMFPQYASSSTGSAVEEVLRVVGAAWNTMPIEIAPPFWDDAGFLDAFAAVARPAIDDARADHVLFSFHGLPERQVVKSDDTRAHCLKSADCCERAGGATLRWCYRAQCLATARALAARLGLADGGWTASFQSRLGKLPWILPHTDVVIGELAARGVKRVAVVCPAFVADCLETLEEIGIRLDEQFRSQGGEALALVPSLNAHPAWADAVAALARRHERKALPAARPALRVVD